MATIKSFTYLSQSKTLSKILPPESADMFYRLGESQLPNVIYGNYDNYFKSYLPCWSLAALLGVLPDDSDIVKSKSDTENEHYMCTVGIKDDIISTFGNNPVDACAAMIEKLHELNLL